MNQSAKLLQIPPLKIRQLSLNFAVKWYDVANLLAKRTLPELLYLESLNQRIARPSPSEKNRSPTTSLLSAVFLVFQGTKCLDSATHRHEIASGSLLLLQEEKSFFFLAVQGVKGKHNSF